MLRGVIFDFNGVLLWDTQLQEEAWAQFARTLRPEPFGPEEMRTHIHGRPNRPVLEHLIGRVLKSIDNLQSSCYTPAGRRRRCLS